MNLTGIISISGRPGLYKVIAQSKNSIIVESLDTNKRIPAYATDRISAIDDISIYTTEADIPLKEVFVSIFEKEKGNNTLSHKEDMKKLEAYLEGVLPNYDKERVYPSDIRKIFQWYNKLNEKGFIKIEKEEVEEPKEDSEKKTKKVPAEKKEEKAKEPAEKKEPKAKKPAEKKEEKAKKPAVAKAKVPKAAEGEKVKKAAAPKKK